MQQQYGILYDCSINSLSIQRVYICIKVLVKEVLHKVRDENYNLHRKI